MLGRTRAEQYEFFAGSFRELIPDKHVLARVAAALGVQSASRLTGKTFIQGGRAALRQALYMPAVVACRFNPDLKAKYDQLIGSGKPAKARHHRRHAQAHRPRERPDPG